MCENQKLGENAYGNDCLFFKDLSMEAQAKILNFKEVKTECDINLDVLPILYHYENVYNMTEVERDIEAFREFGMLEKAQL